MEEKKHKRIREQKHSSIWILIIVIIIVIISIVSLFVDNKKFQNNIEEKKKLEQELEKIKQENKEKEEKEKQEQERQKAYQEEQSKKEEIEKNIPEENKKNVKKIKEEIKEVNNKNNKENKTQKELSQDIQKVIDKSNEKWDDKEKNRADTALELVKKHLGNEGYAYNLMDKVNDNIYMVVVLDNNTREVIGYYYSDIEKNIVVKEE
jgi:uncharacterized protein PF11_0207